MPNFNPKSTIEIINKERSMDDELSENEKRQLLQQYLDVCDKAFINLSYTYSIY